MAVLIMIVSAAAIIVFVKFGLLEGIAHIAGAMKWSAKTRGQVTGYATSLLRGLLPGFDMWAGWGWAVVDFAVIFFGGFGIGGGLWYFSSRLNSD